MNNPYKDLDDHHFWRRAISAVDMHAVDPVVSPKFVIEKSDRVATAGSCFAQHISRRLSSIGFNYFVPESGENLDPDKKLALGYGVFSARYGNIYTVRQLLQTFEEAFGARSKSESAWVREDGRYVDPFRPAIEPAGFASPDDMQEARQIHMKHVRSVFLDADIFVFTLGLTESWLSRTSGDVFPLAPGVSGGSYDSISYEFANFNIEDVVSDLRRFLSQLKCVNPKIRVLLTVSPVPLIATFERRHVLTSTTYSKSVLRVAAEMVTAEFNWVDYFPSFEIITGNFNAGRYYENDLREINSIGVSHVMRCFVRNYIASSSGAGRTTDAEVANSPNDGIAAEQSHFRMDRVVCDEEMIERVSF
ncbi:GSCFA family protein [Paraburkholderia sp. UYCP14C]|uniref:GSCFA domain-containing protein n=1 Tax=Paraburkholderia sp. UYCP14C TaxID=2511130 RepID=UPI0010208DC8|nr:GSCFA domain-containing protein [Paraburkholderia sp. UYCP14C]RZF26928.1 GSCFA family protein [Paraburkholderia sp. UYCP14C]